MRPTRVLLRRTDIFVRIAPGSGSRVVRNNRKFAHFAMRHHDHIAPQAANVRDRRRQNRRKSSKRSPARAH